MVDAALGRAAASGERSQRAAAMREGWGRSPCLQAAGSAAVALEGAEGGSRPCGLKLMSQGRHDQDAPSFLCGESGHPRVAGSLSSCAYCTYPGFRGGVATGAKAAPLALLRRSARG